MRKDSIVKEFKNIAVSGVNFMPEITNFLCNALMDIDDEIRITYNYDKSTQVAAINEYNIFDYNDLKTQSIILKLDTGQIKLDSDNNTKWVFTLNTKKILREYLYNEIHATNINSPFNSIPNNLIPNNKLNELVYSYIDNNILSKYRLKDFILWTEYYELKNNTVPGTTIPLLYKQPQFTHFAIPTNNPDTQKKIVNFKPYNDGIYDISYIQERSSKYFTFIYYFDVIFEKI